MTRRIEYDFLSDNYRILPVNFLISSERMLVNLASARKMFQAVAADIPYYSDIVVTLDFLKTGVGSIKTSAMQTYRKGPGFWSCDCPRCVVSYLRERCPAYVEESVNNNDAQGMFDLETCYDTLRYIVMQQGSRRLRERTSCWVLNRMSVMRTDDLRRKLSKEVEKTHEQVLEIFNLAMLADVDDSQFSLFQS